MKTNFHKKNFALRLALKIEAGLNLGMAYLCNKKAPYGNVSVICNKMLSVVLFLAFEISSRASVSVLLFVDYHLA